ncbi:hypothetical protein [Kitasatospora sp. McL0602]
MRFTRTVRRAAGVSVAAIYDGPGQSLMACVYGPGNGACGPSN